MKKLFNLALFGAIALTGAVGFSSCSSSSDDEVINNPDFDPVTNTVKTTISLSINPNNGSSTRQSGTNVQSSGNFRGISNILSLPSTGDVATTTSLSRKLSWGNIDAFTNSVNYKLYDNQQIVVGVDHFLFIGRATATQSSVADKLAYGFTSNTLATATTVGGIQITPGAMVTSDDLTSSNPTTKNWKYQSDALATYLTTIAKVTNWSTTTNPSLLSMYQEFTRTGAGTTTLYNAGSSESVRLLLTDLLNKVEGVDAGSDATLTGIKSGIRTAIAEKANITGSSGSNTLTWKEACEFKEFPTSLGLPEGSAQYMWDATTTPANPSFKYVTDNTLGSFPAVENYVFPNELYYLTKTPLRATSNATVTWPGTATDWAATTAPWTADATASTWTTAVAANSKNIALTYNINYGSALLATYVKAGAATLYDNARQLDPDKKGDITAGNNAIIVNDGTADKNPFELTGVLVGAQPDAVGWNFLPIDGASFNKVVYDGVMNVTPIYVTTTNNATPNYTLLFDNYRNVTADELNVNVCLEFKNNMNSSFYGKDGIILPGQKFYIVGKLTVNGATNPFASLSEDDVLKAYVPSRVLRAYIQDYLTTANFTLTPGTANGNGDGSLAKAMTTIPDLRQSSQTIGLSVDLEWKSGVTYNVNLGE